MADSNAFDIESKISLLDLYEEKEEFDKEYALACEILEHDPSCGKAYCVKGLSLYYGCGIAENAEAALECWIRGSELKDSSCQNQLLIHYSEGFKKVRPETEARAKEIASEFALFLGSLGVTSFLAGIMTNDDDSKLMDAYAQAYHNFYLARRAGNKDAEKLIMKLFVLDRLKYAEKIPEFDCSHEIAMAKPCAESGDANAMLAMYYLLLKDPDSDVNACNYWLEKAAAEGLDRAVTLYGGMWRNQLIDDAKFNADSYIRGYQKLQQEDAESITNEMTGILGECYMSDRCSTKNLDAAERYLTQAADNGDQRSIRLLAMELQNDGRLRKNESKALRYLEKIIENDENKEVVEAATMLAANIYIRRDTPENISKAKALYQRVVYSNDVEVRTEAENMIEKINAYERQRNERHYDNPPGQSSSKGGCYIATAVYGGYDCPQVCTLRRYRDDVLANSFAGRLFIRIYYKLSPGLVKRFGRSKVFNKFWHGVLDKWVRRLHEQGFDDRPYTDKNIL